IFSDLDRNASHPVYNSSKAGGEDIRGDEERAMQREDVEIDNPCEVSWEGMQGAGLQRHCGHCDEDVVNLSMMTKAEAESFLEANHAPCVRYHLSAEGDILFQTRLQRQRRGAATLLRTAAMLVPLVLGSTAAAAAVRSMEVDSAGQSEASADGIATGVPDLVGVLQDESESLSDALDDGDDQVRWLASSAAGHLSDASAYLADAAEPPDPEGPPDANGPVLMGDLGAPVDR
ncbi:MAG: hypothetical protein ABEN55_24065, partial [Bradymonadaceae bacterium]